jgi:Beta-lactamase enzyme family
MTALGDLLDGLPPGASAQAAAETFGTPQYGGRPQRAAAARSGAVRLRCASLLKPLYVWAAAHCDGPYRGDLERWRADGEPAIRSSDNAATNRVWHGTGPARVLGWIRDRTGVAWSLPGVDPTWFGTVEVTAAEVVTAYGALARARDGDPAADQILKWMRQVLPEQTLGARQAAATPLAADPETVAVKTGWFGHVDEMALRTHAVTITDRPGPHPETVVAAALTALPHPDPEARATYRQRIGDPALVHTTHEKVAGPTLRGLLTAVSTEVS